jgi:hypothetical protein
MSPGSLHSYHPDTRRALLVRLQPVEGNLAGQMVQVAKPDIGGQPQRLRPNRPKVIVI